MQSCVWAKYQYGNRYKRANGHVTTICAWRWRSKHCSANVMEGKLISADDVCFFYRFWMKLRILYWFNHDGCIIYLFIYLSGQCRPDWLLRSYHNHARFDWKLCIVVLLVYLGGKLFFEFLKCFEYSRKTFHNRL